ncbi:MAG: hypothetical protein BGO51_09505 [Rhodospirillales bacterium 69-11]|nr:DUF892 family protein [Rhodospirillales bacterium]MBN8926101.1 DUF892 family protein [Rhodospirillales bacterium]OJW26118.1 MAG: hypothetical protein BGO51_09505 [Rhodospirillales bacterium 69-11]
MSAPTSLKELYVEELRDLWSANDQMAGIVKEMREHARNDGLRNTLEHAVSGIAAHTATLRRLLESQGGTAGPERCRGMEGLVREARAHALSSADDPMLRDLAIIAQYQRMSHYGVAGFGTAAAYAHALGLAEDERTLKSVVGDIYKGDAIATHLAERLESAA